jgi:hypothetical protein
MVYLFLEKAIKDATKDGGIQVFKFAVLSLLKHNHLNQTRLLSKHVRRQGGT